MFCFFFLISLSIWKNHFCNLLELFFFLLHLPKRNIWCLSETWISIYSVKECIRPWSGHHGEPPRPSCRPEALVLSASGNIRIHLSVLLLSLLRDAIPSSVSPIKSLHANLRICSWKSNLWWVIWKRFLSFITSHFYLR